jgi:hypothetical protein
VAPLPEIGLWTRGSGLEIVLLLAGAILLTRFATWLGGRIIRDPRAGQTVVIVVGNSSHATHRMAGSAPVSLARYSAVPLVIVPSCPRSGGSGTENSVMPREVTWCTGSSASLIRAVTGRLPAR